MTTKSQASNLDPNKEIPQWDDGQSQKTCSNWGSFSFPAKLLAQPTRVLVILDQMSSTSITHALVVMTAVSKSHSIESCKAITLVLGLACFSFVISMSSVLLSLLECQSRQGFVEFQHNSLDTGSRSA
jgi:hypothetical protein